MSGGRASVVQAEMRRPRGWVDALDRDMRRAASALEVASGAAGAAPSDNEVAAVEECLWRLTAATEKLDAIHALAFNGKPFVVVADKPTDLTMRPSRDRNKEALDKLATLAARDLVQARAALAGERSRLRRHQLLHSMAPIDELSDLGVFVRVHHRDGRIFGYELLRWSPERWSEGISELSPETLFAQRLKEVERGQAAVMRVIEATATALESDPTVRVPQFVYYDHDTQIQSTERPQSAGPAKSYEVDFILDGSDPAGARRISCTSLMRPGIEITLDEGLWRVIRVEDGVGTADQTAVYRLIEDGD